MRLLALITPLLLLTSIAVADDHEHTFSLPELPYAVDALTPVIDQQTMEIHHGRHHQGYINNLNGLIAEHEALQGLSLHEILAKVSTFPDGVRNNAGGTYNHNLFWQVMAPVDEGGEPSSQLLAQIEEDFGSLEAMKKAFAEAGASRFGSGWAWLIWTKEGKLAVTSTANQDNPLMDVVPEAEQGQPILANDVWEHAYYLNYQNRRGDYLSAWWQVVNWNEVNRRFADASAD